MRDRAAARFIRWSAWAIGGGAIALGAWALTLGGEPFALPLGLATILFAEAGLWQHRRLLKEEAEDNQVSLIPQ